MLSESKGAVAKVPNTGLIFYAEQINSQTAAS